MKIYNLLIIFLLLAVGACSSNDSPHPATNVNTDPDSPLKINAACQNTFLNDARNAFNNENISEISILTTNGKNKYFTCLSKKNDNGGWNLYDGFTDNLRTYYWPWSGMSVFAFSNNINSGDAETIKESDIEFNYRGTGHLYPSKFPYAVDPYNPDHDLLYAAAVNQTMNTNNGTVDLNFRHLLSSITFAVINRNADNDVKITIDDVRIDRICNSGVYNIDVNSSTNPNLATDNQTLPYNEPGYWSNQGYVWDIGFPQGVYQTFTKQTAIDTCEPIMRADGRRLEYFLMPQTHQNHGDAGIPKIAVYYSITATNPEVQDKNVRPAGWQHIDITGHTWQQGKKYLYKLLFDKSLVEVQTFEVDIDAMGVTYEKKIMFDDYKPEHPGWWPKD